MSASSRGSSHHACRSGLTFPGDLSYRRAQTRAMTLHAWQATHIARPPASRTRGGRRGLRLGAAAREPHDWAVLPTRRCVGSDGWSWRPPSWVALCLPSVTAAVTARGGWRLLSQPRKAMRCATVSSTTSAAPATPLPAKRCSRPNPTAGDCSTGGCARPSSGARWSGGARLRCRRSPRRRSPRTGGATPARTGRAREEPQAEPPTAKEHDRDHLTRPGRQRGAGGGHLVHVARVESRMASVGLSTSYADVVDAFPDLALIARVLLLARREAVTFAALSARTEA